MTSGNLSGIAFSYHFPQVIRESCKDLAQLNIEAWKNKRKFCQWLQHPVCSAVVRPRCRWTQTMWKSRLGSKDDTAPKPRMWWQISRYPHPTPQLHTWTKPAWFYRVWAATGFTNSNSNCNSPHFWEPAALIQVSIKDISAQVLNILNFLFPTEKFRDWSYVIIKTFIK